jgi:predicted dehydrogenase
MYNIKKHPMKIPVLLLVFAGLFCLQFGLAQSDIPVRIGIDGLSHDHIHGLLNRHKERTDIRIVGIAEPNKKRAKELAERYGFDMNIVYDDLPTMIERTQPEGVVAFNSIYDHLGTVEVCAPKGIHVMVEKPLAVSREHAAKMERLAKENNIHLLTNYETTWYPTHYKVFEMAVLNREIGNINKVIINDGHKGPVEIGCSPEFLAWLTDPVLNGGGAVTDFGCYGANLMTWIMQNSEPETVTAVLQTIKPDVYPKVDDQATIILTYPHAQAIIQGSWNWPVDRKDLSVYGKEGYVMALNQRDLEYRLTRSLPKQEVKVTEFPSDAKEPFNYFAKVIRGGFKVEAADLSSLENNLIVVKILDAAKRSAAEGRTIYLKE